MKLKDLLKNLTKEDMELDILFSSDEELNTLRSEGEIAKLEDGKLVVYGFDGTEVDDE